MSLPGTTVTAVTNAPARQAAVDTGVWFACGFTEQGPTVATKVLSLDDYISKFGQRVSYGYLYDELDAFFHEGGAEAYIGRVVGPTPVKATHTFLTGTSTNSIIATADFFGTYGNSISVAVLAPLVSGYRLQVSYNGVVVETSGDLTTQADAVAWSAGSAYVTVTLGNGSGAPATISATALAGGTDDHANATDTEWATALALFSKDLGPGQVSMPGRSTATSHANLIAHAVAKNRVAILDMADTGDRATLVTAAGVDRAVSGSDHATAFAPWALIPGLTTGTTRTVPYSGIAAGIMARNDNAGVSPNQPSAGVALSPSGDGYGASRYAIGLTQPSWAGTVGGDRELLNNAGINVARILNGQVVSYGYRTLADPAQPTQVLLLSNARLIMAIIDQATTIGNGYVFRQIDGRGLLFADFAGDLAAMLNRFYTEGSLYGDTAADAFSVDVGSAVNTPTTIAADELHAALALKLSPYAEKVPIKIVSTPIEQGA